MYLVSQFLHLFQQQNQLDNQRHHLPVRDQTLEYVNPYMVQLELEMDFVGYEHHRM